MTFRRAGVRLAFLLTVLLLPLGLGALVRAEGEEPLVLIGPPWPPYLDPQSPDKGLATEIVLASLEAAGYPHSQVQLRPWRRVLLEARQGRVNGLIGLWYSAQRASQFRFSDPYLVSPIVLVSPKEADLNPADLQALEGVRLAYREGARFGAAFDGSETLDKHPVSSTLSMLRMVARGRMDAGLEDGLVLKALLQRDPDLNALLRLGGKPLLKQPLHFAVPADKPGAERLVEAFNLGLKRIRADGRYRALLEDCASVWFEEISVGAPRGEAPSGKEESLE